MIKRNLFAKWLIAPAFAISALLSCDDEKENLTLRDVQDQELDYLADSLAMRDSLAKINAAGLVDYTVTVVSGSRSSIFNNSDDFGGFRKNETQSTIDSVMVTVSQFGKTITKATDVNGIATFPGFLRGGLSVTIKKDGYTTASYIAHVAQSNATPNNSRTMIGNLIPIFELTGPNTATIKGRLTVQSNLTNTTTELVPDGTTVLANIDVTDDFAWTFLNFDWVTWFNLEMYDDYVYDEENPNTPPYVNTYTASIMNASYETGVIGSTTNGEYTITVPAAINGLPMEIEASDISLTQTLFESSDLGVNNSVQYRTNFGPSFFGATDIPAAGGVEINFVTGSGAMATAQISEEGEVQRINIIKGGRGYGDAPRIEIDEPAFGGVRAEATADVTNGKITGITLTNPGSGYTTAPTVKIVAGGGAAASTFLTGLTSVRAITISNSGNGYTTRPDVTFADPADPDGVTAAGTAQILNGKVHSITITNPGSRYTAAEITAPGFITIEPAPAGGNDAFATAVPNGFNIERVEIDANGDDYSYAPTVIFGAPNLSNGVQATGEAIYDANIKGVVGIRITNPGSGYTTAPDVFFDAGSGAELAAEFVGRGVMSVNINDGGMQYTTAPTVVFESVDGAGSGAAGTAVVEAGKVVAINISSAGSGYNFAPEVKFVSGEGAKAYAVVQNGKITSIEVTNGGFGYTGAPQVEIETMAEGTGATAVATVANGEVTDVTVTNGGGAYINGNTPAFEVEYSGIDDVDTKPGLTYIRDINYGTGVRQPK